MLQDMSEGESDGGEVTVSDQESDGEIDDPSFSPDEESSSEDEEPAPPKRRRLLEAGEEPPTLPLSLPSGTAGAMTGKLLAYNRTILVLACLGHL